MLVTSCSSCCSTTESSVAASSSPSSPPHCGAWVSHSYPSSPPEEVTVPADGAAGSEAWMGTISRTGIQEIVGSAFAGCTQLQCIKLSNTLRRIGREAFRKCGSLEVLHTPPALLYINKRAFAECTQLCKLVRTGKKELGGGPM